MHVSFLEIDLSNKLFRDYLYGFSKVEKFFPVNYQGAEKIKTHLQRVASKHHDRLKLAEILTRQNNFYGNSPRALDEIQKLTDQRTVAVVTGQQMGLFTGPLYTLYKAIGAAKLCAYYQNQFPDYHFVPIFWMELEDHDFEEIRSIHLLSVENDLRKIVYDGSDPANVLKNPINKIALDADIVRVIQEIKTVLNKTDFTDALFQTVESAYGERNSIADGFGKWMASLLGKFGLILMDPSDREFKNLAKPVFEKELSHAAEVHQLFTNQSRALIDAGYTAQVETEPTNIFLLDDKDKKLAFNKNARHKFRLTLADAAAHAAELHTLLEAAPERFIPNVVLRPIIQDVLLPTFAYVGGPSEIAYFAQYKTLYDYFDVIEPMIIPRPFVTLLEKKNKKVLDKYGVTLKDIFNNPSGILDHAASKSAGASVASMFENFLSNTKTQFNEIEKQLMPIDPTLKGAAATALEKISQAVKVLRDKSREAEKRGHELTHSQLSKALNHLYPNNKFQERELNVLYYLNKYGMDLPDTLFEQIDIQSHDHQIIEL